MAVDVGSAVGYLDLDISGFLTNLKSAQNEANNSTKNMAQSVGANISGMGKNMSSVGSNLTKSVTLPLAGIGVAGLKVATDFEKGMSEVKAISGATGKDFDALREKAIELGADTAFSSGEVATAMTEMAKAGWDSQQIIDGMGGVLAAAAASGESLGTTSTIVADAITGFGLAASDSTRVADLLTQAANSGTIGITDLGESFKYLAPVAGAMDLSIEDCTTAISAMSMAGIKGSQAGTSLRTMLTNLVKPTDNMAASMKELGIEVTNQDGSMKSLDEIIANLRNSFAGLSESEKAYHAATLAGKEGMSGMLALLNLSEEEYNAIAESMDNAGGVAEKTAAIMQDNLQSKLEQMGGSLESLAIKMADYVIPYLQKFVEWLTGLIDKFANLSPETQKTILVIAGIAAAIGPVLTVVGKLTTGVGNMITMFGNIPGAVTKVKGGFSALSTGLTNMKEGFALSKAGFSGLATEAGGFGTKIGVMAAGITGPMIAIAAVVAVLVAAFVSLWKNNEEFRNNIIGIWNQIKATFEEFAQGIVDRLNALGFDFENIGEVLKAIWEGFCNFLAPIFTGVFQNIQIVLEVALDVIMGIVDFFIGLFTGNWEQCWNGIKGIFEGIWNGISSWFSNILNVIKGVLDVVLGWFGTSWEQCWNSIKEVFENIWNGIKDFFVTIWDGISSAFKSAWNGISTFFVGAWDFIKGTLQSAFDFIVNIITFYFDLITIPFRFIWENCKDTIISIWDAIKEKVSTVIDAVKLVIETVFNAIKLYVTTVWNAIKTVITTVINAIKSVIETVFNAIKLYMTTVWNAIKTAVTTVVEAIKSVVEKVFNAIKTTATTIWEAIKSAIETPINAAKTTISNVIDSIKSTFTTGLNAAKGTVTSVFDSIKSKIQSVMDGAKSIVTGAVDKFKSAFKFEWKLPDLKLPHISVQGGEAPYGIGGKGKLPSFSIEWYKKAMNNGIILNDPTIFGFDSKTGKFLAGGEAGSEVVVGTQSLMQMIRQAVAEVIRPMIAMTYQLAKASTELGYVTYNGFTKVKERLDEGENLEPDDSGNGDTFIFNSPKPIDEIEAARQMKKAKRELAEGF